MGLFSKTGTPADPLRDRLTGLKNRDFFHKTYGELGRLESGVYRSMAVFDIDHFKAANDRIDGDKALLQVVQLAQEAIGMDGELMRWGGDEFLAILSVKPEEAKVRMKTFTDNVARDTQVTVSVGITEINADDTFKMNYYRAVQHCYAAKESGGNAVR